MDGLWVQKAFEIVVFGCRQEAGNRIAVRLPERHAINFACRAAQRRLMSIGLMPGSRLPAHCTSTGRVLLAALPEEEAKAMIDRSGLAPRSPHSLTSPSEIMARVADARRLGYALIDQEVEIGLRAIAVPLLSVHGRVVAALNTGVAAVHSEPELLVAEYLPELLKVQDGLRRVLR